MRIIITGGRDYTDKARLAEVLYEAANVKSRNDCVIVHGACPTGADALAAKVASTWGLPTEPHPANWELDHRAAGPIRNQEMVDLGADLVIAFPGGRGTRDCVRRAKRAGIPVREES